MYLIKMLDPRLRKDDIGENMLFLELTGYKKQDGSRGPKTPGWQDLLASSFLQKKITYLINLCN